MSDFIYLASSSPRRRELLQQVGIAYRLMVPEVDESVLPGELPADYVTRLAQAKASAGWRMTAGDAPALGADTAVVIDGFILGKPRDGEDALAMLQRLNGREHEVFSAVAVCHNGRAEQTLSVSRVRFTQVDEILLHAYVSSGEPLDKAGAYAIQGRGAAFIENLNGSYSGVMGLPLFETLQLLARFGVTGF